MILRAVPNAVFPGMSKYKIVTKTDCCCKFVSCLVEISLKENSLHNRKKS